MPSTAATSSMDVDTSIGTQGMSQTNVSNTDAKESELTNLLTDMLKKGNDQLHTFVTFDELVNKEEFKVISDMNKIVIGALQNTENDWLAKVNSVTSDDAQINPGSVKAVLRDMANRMSTILLLVGTLGRRTRTEMGDLGKEVKGSLGKLQMMETAHSTMLNSHEIRLTQLGGIGGTGVMGTQGSGFKRII